jgi:3-methylcrotonyl-CoA carboxylase alpha subunit
VLLYREPRMPGVRIDSGIAEGHDVPVHYDPLLAKIIASAESRELARVRLIAALRDFPILGVRTNMPFLLGVLDHPRFRAGEIDTAFLDEAGEMLAEQVDAAVPELVLAAMADAGLSDPTGAADADPRSAWDPWRQLRGWRG